MSPQTYRKASEIQPGWMLFTGSGWCRVLSVREEPCDWDRESKTIIFFTYLTPRGTITKIGWFPFRNLSCKTFDDEPDHVQKS